MKKKDTKLQALPAIAMVKKTSSLGTLLIKPIHKRQAKAMIVENHYSHKWNDGGFGAYNFGIFHMDESDKCLGVAVYGYMKNPKAKIFTHPNPKAWITELNRLWISDCLGHNAETVLLGASIKMLQKIDPNIVAVQSFADGRLGCGTIYKAANFKYYGYHYTKFLRNVRTSEVTHEQIFSNTTSPSGYIRSNIAYLLGDLECFAVKTYRYIYPLCKQVEFKFKEQTYPPYEKGETAVTWNRDHSRIKDNIISLLSKVAG